VTEDVAAPSADFETSSGGRRAHPCSRVAPAKNAAADLVGWRGAVWSAPVQQLNNWPGVSIVRSSPTLNGKGTSTSAIRIRSATPARCAPKIAPHADAMLAVGCRFTEVMTWFWKMKGSRATRPDRY